MKASALAMALSIVLMSTAAVAELPATSPEHTGASGQMWLQDSATKGSKAEVPLLMNFQGTLTDDAGVAVDTTVSMAFSIYSDSVDGVQVWTEVQPVVQVSHGIFNVLLGSVNALSDTVFKDPSRWLGIQVGDDAELSPRQQIAAVGYAFRASQADTADYARSVSGGGDGDWTISGDDIYSAVSGNVGIGNTSPATKLHVGSSPSSGQRAQIEGLTVLRTNASGQPTILRLSNLNGLLNSGVSVDFQGLNSGSTQRDAARISGFLTDQTVASEEGALSFSTTDNGDDGLAERLRIDKDGNVGIGTTSPSARLDVQGTMNVGEDDTGYDVNFYGASTGSRLFWDESKMALRAGQVSGSQWDDANMGSFSFAAGTNPMASGNNAAALGYGPTASGEASMATGWLSDASGNFSTAMGSFAMAHGPWSVAIGKYVAAETTNAFVLGSGINVPSPLANDIENSLMIGFDDTTATLFVGGGDKRVGIGTTNPSAKLDIRGTLNVGTTLESYDVTFYGQGNGSRFFWDEDKMALRAGRDLNGTHWAPDSIGQLSLALGAETKAKGVASCALGSGTTASGLAATAMGVGTRAEGDNSTAMGYYSAATRWGSVAMGHSTTASGYSSVAMGRMSTARGYAATAMGTQTMASGDKATAMGQLTTASGVNSTAMGQYTAASGDYSVAIGRYLRAGPSDYTFVIGNGISDTDSLINNVANSLMVGFNDTTATLFVGGGDHRVGVGTESPVAKLHVHGTLSVGEDDTGYDANIYGSESGSRLLWDEDKMALRAGRDFDGTHWAPDSVGQYSLAIGYNTLASGEAAASIGLSTRASGKWSTAMGGNTIASGWAATSMGLWTTASADYSTAIGRYVTAQAQDAIVLGRGIISANRLVNNIENSLMVGFNTTTATLFVGGSDHRVGVKTTSPTAQLDVNGATGYDQLRLRSSYTPTDSTDANGNVGDIAWDDDYVYIKTNDGWKRAALSTF